MLREITDDLIRDLEGLRFGPPVTHVYNPLVYARAPWDLYCARYGAAPREILAMGMNPGPWGMSQVGVPFGEVTLVRTWLGIEAPVGKPAVEHPRRPVEGFACRRSEVSGTRVWTWARDRFGTPERFFSRFFIWNYCPLVFMGQTGVNITPDKLPLSERQPLFRACDRALRRVLDHFQPRLAIGIGRFAEARLRGVLGDGPCAVGVAPHPSPASPAANRGWAELMDRALSEMGVGAHSKIDG